MNLFEDLVPGGSGNPFADLIPGGDPLDARLEAMASRVAGMQSGYQAPEPVAPPPMAAPPLRSPFEDLVPYERPMTGASSVMPSLTQELDATTPVMEPGRATGFEPQSSWLMPPDIRAAGDMGPMGGFADLLPPDPAAPHWSAQTGADIQGIQQAGQAGVVMPGDTWDAAGWAASSGFDQLRQGGNAIAAQLAGRALSIMNRVDAGQPVSEIEDILGYGQMDPAQRQAARAEIEGQLGDTVWSMRQRGQDIAGTPQPAALVRMGQAKDFNEGWSAFMSDPLGVIGYATVQSLVASSPSLAMGAAGRVAGGIPGLMVGTGLGSAGVEFGSGIIEAIAEGGVNLSDAQAVAAALTDQNFMADVRNRAAAKAAAVGAFDAAGAGLAGVAMRPAGVGGRTGALIEAGPQFATQAGTGMAGEAVGQIAQGEDLKWGPILLEGVAEAGSAPTDIALARSGRGEPAATMLPDGAIQMPPIEVRPEIDQGTGRVEPPPLSVPTVPLEEVPPLPGPEEQYRPGETIQAYQRRLGVEPNTPEGDAVAAEWRRQFRARRDAARERDAIVAAMPAPNENEAFPDYAARNGLQPGTADYDNGLRRWSDARDADRARRSADALDQQRVSAEGIRDRWTGLVHSWMERGSDGDTLHLDDAIEGEAPLVLRVSVKTGSDGGRHIARALMRALPDGTEQLYAQSIDGTWRGGPGESTIPMYGRAIEETGKRSPSTEARPGPLAPVAPEFQVGAVPEGAMAGEALIGTVEPPNVSRETVPVRGPITPPLDSALPIGEAGVPPIVDDANAPVDALDLPGPVSPLAPPAAADPAQAPGVPDGMAPGVAGGEPGMPAAGPAAPVADPAVAGALPAEAVAAPAPPVVPDGLALGPGQPGSVVDVDAGGPLAAPAPPRAPDAMGAPPLAPDVPAAPLPGEPPAAPLPPPDQPATAPDAVAPQAPGAGAVPQAASPDQEAGRPGPAPARVGEPDQVGTFTTAKGSTYRLFSDGTTIRDKAARAEHPGDSGIKDRSVRTIYLSEDDAGRMAPPSSATWRIIEHPDGTYSTATRRDDGRWGISPSSRNVKVLTEPAVGLTPLELWRPETLNGLPAYGKLHFGNLITAMDAPESAPAPPGAAGPAEAPAAPSTLGERVVRSDTSLTPAGTEVPVRYAVVELDRLTPSQTDDGNPNPAFTGAQPRDRTRAASRAQVAEIAGRLDQRLLDVSPSTADGAPLVGRDGMVDSGNGRVLAMRRAYRMGLASAGRYRAALAAKGYPVEGMKRPVFVRINDAPEDQRGQIAVESNERSTLAMSSTEQAMADAKAMTDVLPTYRGGEVTAAANREFVRKFVEAAVPAGDRSGVIDSQGQLSAPGVRRIQAAMLAAAYGDAQLVETLIESQDNDIKAIGGALVDAAPAWAQMRQEGERGEIDPEVADATPDLLEAVRLVQKARADGQHVADLVGQTDMFTGRAMKPEAELFLRLFFRDDRFRTQRGRAKIAIALNYYADEARKTQPGPGLFGDSDKATRRGILEKARTNADREQPVREGQLSFPGAGREEGGGRGQGVRPAGDQDGRGTSVQSEDGPRDRPPAAAQERVAPPVEEPMASAPLDRIEALTAQARERRAERAAAGADQAAFQRAHDALMPIATELGRLTGHPLGLDDPATAARFRPAARAFAPDPAVVQSAVNIFGIAKNARTAGYILADGRMLEFGDDGGDRGIDHRAVSQVAGVDGDGTAAMIDFMNKTGAARVDFNSGLFEVQRPPTPRQVSTVVREARREGVQLLAEVSRVDGSSIVSRNFDRPNVEEVARFFGSVAWDPSVAPPQAAAPLSERIEPAAAAPDTWEVFDTRSGETVLVTENETEAQDEAESRGPNFDYARKEAPAPDDPAGVRVERPSPGTRALHPINPEYEAKLPAWEAALQKVVDQILGPGRVELRGAAQIYAGKNELGGAYYRTQNLIYAAMSADERQGGDIIARHEAMHAAWTLGLFSADDKAAMRKAARENPKWKAKMADILATPAYANLAEVDRVEETAAHMFQEFRAGRRTGIPAIDAAFQRLARLYDAIRAYLREQLGFEPDWQDLFQAINRGDLAERGGIGSPPTAASEAELMASALERHTERTRTVLDAIKDGQPIDRIFRLPFRAIGGVNERGEWKPGVRLTGWGAKVINESKLNPDGPLAWLNPALEKARAGLIDRYGQDPAYIARDRERQNEETRLGRQGLEVVRGLVHNGMDANEAKVLQAVLTGEDIGGAEWKAIAAPIRAAIDEMGADAVALGLISPESYARNRGAYLHRSYIKHEVTPEGGGLGKLAQTMGRSQRAKLIGSELKGRGIFIDVDNEQIDPIHRTMKSMIRVLDDQRPDTTGKVKNWARVFLPAGQAVPAKYADWTDKGSWEVRRTGPNKVTLWRDYTPSEREQMGEILDARYTIAKTFYLMAHDLATGRFYQDIALNEEWATKMQPPEGTWVNAREAKYFAQLATDVEWVKVPDTTIEGTGGVKKWGALAGMYVRSEIWRDINEVAAAANRNLWDQFLTQWKLNKTARSPVTHMNNVMSNLTFMDMNDVRMQDLAAGIRSFMAKDQDFKDAEANGAFGTGFVGAEIKRDILEPILREIEEQATGKKSIGIATRWLNNMGLLGRTMAALGRGLKAADDKMLHAYRTEDDIFRMALYKRRLAMGDSPLAAADAAREVFLDYDIRAPWVNAARRSALPFIAYTYRAIPGIAKAIATKPWKLAKYAALAQMANWAAYSMFPRTGDDDGGEDEERKNLRKDQRGYTWLGSPRMLRLWVDGDGPNFLDIRRFIPAGDVFDLNQGSSAIPLPSWLQLGGPLALAGELALNRSNFTGKDIVNKKTDDAMSQAGKIADYLWKSWMPSAVWVPGSWYQQKVADALSGVRDRTGNELDPVKALISSFGIKVQGMDLNQAKYYRQAAYEGIKRDLAFDRNRSIDDRSRGALSESAHKALMADIAAKEKKAEAEVADVLADRAFQAWLKSFEAKRRTERTKAKNEAKREAASP